MQETRQTYTRKGSIDHHLQVITMITRVTGSPRLAQRVLVEDAWINVQVRGELAAACDTLVTLAAWGLLRVRGAGAAARFPPRLRSRAHKGNRQIMRRVSLDRRLEHTQTQGISSRYCVVGFEQR